MKTPPVTAEIPLLDKANRLSLKMAEAAEKYYGKKGCVLYWFDQDVSLLKMTRYEKKHPDWRNVLEVKVSVTKWPNVSRWINLAEKVLALKKGNDFIKESTPGKR